MDAWGIGKAYDQTVARYLSERHLLRTDKYVHKLVKLLPVNSRILDLGCGAGKPVDALLYEKGHSVIGVDISQEMIRRARINCPGCEYTVGDITKIMSGTYSVDAVVSFYTFFHIDRTLHGKLLRTARSFLRKNGHLLITLGDKDFEGFTDFYGTKMWWSQWGPEKNRMLIEKANFRILFEELDTTGSERHHVLLAQAV